MLTHKLLLNGLIGLTATVLVSAHVVSGDAPSRPAAFLTASAVRSDTAPAPAREPATGVVAHVTDAVAAFSNLVRPLSHPKALESAFRGYFAFLSENPDEVKKPYLYFVDYGLPSTEPRGYVFDMRR
jgi:hypothetical protein